MRVLIVDDSRFVRSYVRELLESRGFECTEAPDGGSGLSLLHQSAPFDLALVDWNMPHMNGLQMLKSLRGQGFDRMKVMMVTTEAENSFIESALNAGADEYLMKPFDEEALREKLVLLGIEEA